MDIPEKISSTEKAPDNSGEIRIFDKGDGPGKRKENFSAGRTLFVVGFIVAILCIGIGIFKAWEAFREFDETIMREKDSQFYSLISSEDISLENSLDSFCREAETYFERQVLKQLVREWNESEDGSTKDLREYISSNNLTENPVYSDILMMKDGSQVLSASGRKGFSMLTDADGRGIRICADQEGNYYMAYETVASGGISYEALIDLEKLYLTSLGENRGRGVILVDSTSTILIARQRGETLIIPVAEADGTRISRHRDFMIESQGTQKSGGLSVDVEDTKGHTHTERIVVQPSGRTTNGEFAIGITADFDEALRPSRHAAEMILFFGGMAVAGIIVLIFMLILLRRVNTANERDLEVLKKKNTAMEELNQNMQALAHHQRLETIGTMTASIAHDFNNLLTPIMGYSIMAAEMLPDDQTEIQDYMMEVYNASVKAKDIVQRLADLSKKGKEESYKTLDPVEIIRSSLKVTLPAKPKNVEVRGRFSSGMARIRGDATQISQLVINIVLNAYDAMREKGGVLTVSTRIEEGGVAMRFTDTGTGMDAETLARIFDPFYTTKESGKGTGLGLAIVHQICDTHGAKVYVDSEPGAGTEFRIIFPIVEAENMDKATTRVINGAEIRERLDKPDEI